MTNLIKERETLKGFIKVAQSSEGQKMLKNLKPSITHEEIEDAIRTGKKLEPVKRDANYHIVL